MWIYVPRRMHIDAHTDTFTRSLTPRPAAEVQLCGGCCEDLWRCEGKKALEAPTRLLPNGKSWHLPWEAVGCGCCSHRHDSTCHTEYGNLFWWMKQLQWATRRCTAAVSARCPFICQHNASDMAFILAAGAVLTVILYSTWWREKGNRYSMSVTWMGPQVLQTWPVLAVRSSVRPFFDPVCWLRY